MSKKSLEKFTHLDKLSAIVRSIDALEYCAIDHSQLVKDYQLQANIMTVHLIDMAEMYLNFFRAFTLEDLNKAIANGGWEYWKFGIVSVESNSTMPWTKLEIVEA